MNTLADRFRTWYDHERDCNAKTLEMLASVPMEQRGKPEYQKALDRMGHLTATRQRWLNRLTRGPESPGFFPKNCELTSLTNTIAETEAAWVAYLKTLDDNDLAREFEWQAMDGKRYRWTVEGVLTQVNGHAWYHRGQIAQLVAALGGKAMDTDYIFWCKLTPINATA